MNRETLKEMPVVTVEQIVRFRQATLEYVAQLEQQLAEKDDFIAEMVAAEEKGRAAYNNQQRRIADIERQLAEALEQRDRAGRHPIDAARNGQNTTTERNEL